MNVSLSVTLLIRAIIFIIRQIPAVPVSKQSAGCQSPYIGLEDLPISNSLVTEYRLERLVSVIESWYVVLGGLPLKRAVRSQCESGLVSFPIPEYKGIKTI